MSAAGGVDEVRIEMVCAPEVAESVLEAARGAHPYEEPLIIAVDGVRARGRARLGRICTWRMDATLADLAQHVAAHLQTDVRVWGVPESPVSRIAVANGSAGSLLRTAAQRAEVILAGEVRYHDALSASAAGLAIIEAGHDVTEWPLVEVLYDTARDLLPGTPVVRENPARGWWTTEAANDRR
jgi:putative NIF3 family GTP cyclohydrolase 1 type 2